MAPTNSEIWLLVPFMNMYHSISGFCRHFTFRYVCIFKVCLTLLINNVQIENNYCIICHDFYLGPVILILANSEVQRFLSGQEMGCNRNTSGKGSGIHLLIFQCMFQLSGFNSQGNIVVPLPIVSHNFNLGKLRDVTVTAFKR